MENNNNGAILALAVGTLITGGVAMALSEIERRTPLKTTNGQHFVATCFNSATGRDHFIDSKKVTAVSRPFGRNTWEFNDAVSGQKVEIRESQLSSVSCNINKAPVVK